MGTENSTSIDLEPEEAKEPRQNMNGGFVLTWHHAVRQYTTHGTNAETETEKIWICLQTRPTPHRVTEAVLGLLPANERGDQLAPRWVDLRSTNEETSNGGSRQRTLERQVEEPEPPGPGGLVLARRRWQPQRWQSPITICLASKL